MSTINKFYIYIFTLHAHTVTISNVKGKRFETKLRNASLLHYLRIQLTLHGSVKKKFVRAILGKVWLQSLLSIQRSVQLYFQLFSFFPERNKPFIFWCSIRPLRTTRHKPRCCSENSQTTHQQEAALKLEQWCFSKY